jgi:SAM-dependent methyltransferase
MQKVLSSEQVEAFYHDQFVEDQSRHFIAMLGADAAHRSVTDVGGGCGFFARRISQLTGCRIKVMDMDAASIEACRRAGVQAVRADALDPQISGDEDVITLNLILHHLVGPSEKVTLELQRKALQVWTKHARAIFVNEYIYESYVANLSGWFIYQITSNRILSSIGRMAAKVVPAFHANTFSVGVRFRAHQEWRRLFEAAGFEVRASEIGATEKVALPLRLLLIKCIRRDSFLLLPRALT